MIADAALVLPYLDTQEHVDSGMGAITAGSIDSILNSRRGLHRVLPLPSARLLGTWTR